MAYKTKRQKKKKALFKKYRGITVNLYHGRCRVTNEEKERLRFEREGERVDKAKDRGCPGCNDTGREIGTTTMCSVCYGTGKGSAWYSYLQYIGMLR